MITILIILAIAILAIFTAWPKIGLYLLALSLPLIGIELSLFNLNIPIVDLIALNLLLAFFLNLIFKFLSGKKLKKLSWPFFIPFSFFLIISLISVLLSDNLNNSLYYFLRWPFFLYFAYILVPANIIKNPRILKNTIILVFISSLLVLFSGFFSLLGQNIYDNFFRIKGLNLFGFYPFGDNHNLIAEFLNIGVFITLIIRDFLKEKRLKNIIDIIFIISLLGLILTFSRAAWITLILQLIVYLAYKAYFKKKERVPIVLISCLFLLLLSPLFFKMEELQRDNIGSTQSRALSNQVAILAVLERPWFGHGSGQFINLVDKNTRFKAQHGEAIEAHSFLPKILAENGFIGLLAWLFILFYLFKISYLALKRYYPKINWILPLCLAVWGGLFFQVFNTSYFKGKVWLPILLLFLAIKFLDKLYVKKNKSAPPIT
jgi:putative inorganic carbon (hco3(-)) transporter